jgi:phosphinothricin acetyltransferase
MSPSAVATDAVAGVEIRRARAEDLPAITRIYNHYVVETAITFDVEPYSVEARQPWFAQFSADGPLQLLVAETGQDIVGYCGTLRFRPKPAYDTSVEVTVYCDPDRVHRGLGGALYTVLFDELRGQDLRRAFAGITLPNDPSIALHERFGFSHIGTFSQAGRKLGRYWDVAWYEKPLGDGSGQ